MTCQSVFSGYKQNSLAASINRQSVSSLPGFSVGWNFYQNKRRNYIKYGLLYTLFRETFQYTGNTFEIRQVPYYKYFTRNEIVKDTVWFVDLDALLHGDTVWVPLLIDKPIKVTDSVYTTRNDTTKYFRTTESVNRMSYIELPLIFGFEYKMRNLTFYPEFGIIGGIILNSKVKMLYLSASAKASEIRENIEPKRFNLAVCTGIRTEYFLFKRLVLVSGLYFRQNLFSMWTDKTISKKYRNFGFTIGVCLKI